MAIRKSIARLTDELRSAYLTSLETTAAYACDETFTPDVGSYLSREHEHTLLAANQLVLSLVTLREDPKKPSLLVRKTMPVTRRVLGESDGAQDG